jgi:hypothetical protein
MTRFAAITFAAAIVAACRGPGDASGSESAGTTAESDAGSAGDGDGDSEADGDGDGEEGPIFDVEGDGDTGGLPNDCDDEAVGETTVGCTFFAVDLDQAGIFENEQFAAVVSNVQAGQVASVTVEQKQAGMWVPIQGPVDVEPLDLHVFSLPNAPQLGSGLDVGGAYRIVADVPIVAYQFNPLAAGWWSSDASLLYPASAWDTLAHVVGWGAGADGDRAYIVIVASQDATLVTVTPTVATTGGTGVPAGQPGQELAILLSAGDVAHVAAADQNASLTGTRIEADRPVGVFSGHSCAFVPGDKYACDHLEEQLPGLRLWGERFAAARMPVRTPNAPERSLWQIYASEDGTTVTFTVPAGVTGVPGAAANLDAGELLELWVAGPPSAPGDFFVEADKPIALLNYMTGWEDLTDLETGDPAMVQLGPVEQFLDRYVVLVPSKWDNDYLVITRPEGATVTVDGNDVDDVQFGPAGAGYEVGRIFIADGVHELHGSHPFAVEVVGYDYADSYAYLGGIGTGRINPEPQG